MIKYPTVSFIIPTYNADEYLDLCLKSIFKQKYPKDKFEVLLIDAGSTDDTLKIAKKYKVKIIKNPKKNPEIAKSIGIKKSKSDYIALIDSDNVIIKNTWLKAMVAPFMKDNDLFGVESYYYPMPDDNIFNSYCMVIHIADPFSRCLAKSPKKTQRDGYEEYEIEKNAVYPLGANGFIWNKRIIKEVGHYKDIFEESNFMYYVTRAGYRKFARVRGYGIYHYYIKNLGDFINKRLKIGGKFLLRKKEKKETWLKPVSKTRFVLCTLYCISIIGPLIEAIYMILKTRQKSWIIHPLMAFVSVSTYAYVVVKNKVYTY